MIASDIWIRKMAKEHGMIDPFCERLVTQGKISYGLSSYGYDVRVGSHFKIFHNLNSTLVDPKNFDSRSFVDHEGDCIIPPNSFALAETVERFRIPRNVLCCCLGKSTYARCFSGSTRVALVDGTAPTLEEMADRARDGELFWGYAVGEHGRIVVALLDAPRWIGRDALLEITLDDGSVVECTPDHGFLRRDGTIAEAHTLRVGDGLFPLHRQVVRGRELVQQPTGRLVATSRLVEACQVRNGMLGEEELAVAGVRDAGGLVQGAWAGEPRRAHRPVRRGAGLPRGDRFGFGTDPRIDGGAGGGFAAGSERTIVAIRERAGDHDVYCLTVPEAGNFALDAGVFVKNCGIIVNVTPLEPEWEGVITIEISNTTPLPAKIYAGEGIAQILFFLGDQVCETSYADRKGKYQNQAGLTLPKVLG